MQRLARPTGQQQLTLVLTSFSKMLMAVVSERIEALVFLKDDVSETERFIENRR